MEFSRCHEKTCLYIHIHNDKTVEVTESFAITLERTSGLDKRIMLTVVDGEVEILNDDSKSVHQCRFC